MLTRLATALLILGLVACTRDVMRGAPVEGGGGGPVAPDASPIGTSPVFVTPPETPVPAANIPISPGPVPVVIVSPAIGPIPSPSPIGTYAPIFPSATP
jgi:hypothetical protein